MKIRTKLTLEYIASVALSFLLCFSLIYILLAENRKAEFYRRLESKARTSAELLMDVEHFDSLQLRIYDRTQKDTLSQRYIIMFDRSGKVIYTNKDTFDFIVKPELTRDVWQKQKIFFKFKRLDMLGMVYHARRGDLAIVTGAIDTASKEKNDYLLNLMAFLFSISLLIIAFTGWIFAQRALTPLSYLMNEINQLPIHSRKARLQLHNSNDEIGQLTMTFNTLLNRLEQASKVQKLFLSSASHEMKNPLTMITSQLQVLRLKSRNAEEYRQVIDSVLEDLQKLNETTNSIIEFSRISYEVNIDQTLTAVRVDDILWHCIDSINKLNPARQAIVQFINPPKNHDDLVIQANEDLLKVAFMNLLDNAFKFSRSNVVHVSIEINDRACILSFSDDGVGISPDEVGHLFEPFYRSSKTSAIAGHGLGLAIVKRILDFHKAEIMVESTPGKGSTFRVVLQRKF